MSSKLCKKFGFTLGVLMALLVFIAILAGSWLTTCGLIYIMTLCFGWEFSWSIATGFWVLMILIRTLFNGIGKNK